MLSKLLLFLVVFINLFVATPAFAATTPTTDPKGIHTNFNPPANYGVAPGTPLGTIFSNIITIVFVLAAVVVLIMLIWGAFEWIFSAGDKEKIEKARGRIVNALIGLVLLALAFLILKVVGQLVNIDIFGNTPLHPLGQTQGQAELTTTPTPCVPGPASAANPNPC